MQLDEKDRRRARSSCPSRPSCLSRPSGPSCPCYDSDVRIGIDARKLHDFGIGTYIRNLLRQLARLDQHTEFVVLCRPADTGPVLSLGENFRAVAETAANYSLAEQVKIPLALKREAVTL